MIDENGNAYALVKDWKNDPTGKTFAWKLVGTIHKDCLTKRVKPNHQLKKPKGYAWDLSIIQEAIDRGVTTTRLHKATQDGRMTPEHLEAPLSMFLTHGVPLERAKYREQICLPMQYWDQYVSGILVTPGRRTKVKEQPAGEQLSLGL